MNIYYLDSDPQTCAQYHADSHVCKMILETAQILCTALRINGLTGNCGLYAATHVHHPCVKWAANYQPNFAWLQQLGFYLCEEYTYRYGREHKSEAIIHRALSFVNSVSWPEEATIRFPQCMPAVYKDEFDCRSAYRNYYLGEKTHLLKYTRRHVPDFIACMALGEHKD